MEEFGFGVKKIHKVIQDERQHLKHLLLADRARNLPIDDIRRMAFFANGTDPFARQFLGTTPVGDTPFTPSEYTTAVALHMGVLIQAIKNRVGEAIRNNPNCHSPRLTTMGTTSQRSPESKEAGPSAITTLSPEPYQTAYRQQASNTWEEQQIAPAKPSSEMPSPLRLQSAMTRANRLTA